MCGPNARQRARDGMRRGAHRPVQGDNLPILAIAAVN